MSGETNLNTLLQSMQPLLHPEEYVFCTLGDKPGGMASLRDFSDSHLTPVCIFRESEGITLILSRQQADAAALAYTALFSMITLDVHSSLEAVGFLAAITSKLAEHNISVNPVSAYYHDRLFVPVDRAEEAISLLEEFSNSNTDKIN